MANTIKKAKRTQKLKNRNAKVVKKLSRKQLKLISEIDLKNTTMTKTIFNENGDELEFVEGISGDEIKQAMLNGMVFTEINYDKMRDPIVDNGHKLMLLRPEVIKLMDHNKFAKMAKDDVDEALKKGNIIYVCANCGNQFDVPAYATKITKHSV